MRRRCIIVVHHGRQIYSAHYLHLTVSLHTRCGHCRGDTIARSLGHASSVCHTLEVIETPWHVCIVQKVIQSHKKASTRMIVSAAFTDDR